MRLSRPLRSALSAFAILLVTASAAFAETILRRGNGSEPGSLDPHFVSGSWENNIVGDIFMGLMTEAADGTTIPGAAESYEMSEDGTVYTFKIREGHVWSDGVPVTAEDFVFAYRRILNPLTAAEYASLLYPIKNAEAVNTDKLPAEDLGVRAIDPRTLEITLENPTPFFLDLLTHFTSFPVPKHAVEAFGKEWIKPGNIVSNGAFTLVDWRPRDYIETKKNPLFFDAANVALDGVRFIPTNDAQAALKQFRAGELDTNSGAPVQQLEWMKANIPQELRISPYLTISYLSFNTTDPVASDPRVRLALSMTIERELVTDCILKTGQKPAYHFIPPGVGNYEPGPPMSFAGLPREERLERARQLLADAGYSKENPLTLEYSYIESTTGRRVAVLIQAMWKEIGFVTTPLLRAEARVHYNNLRQQNFQIAGAGWIADYNDPQNFLFLLESSSGQMNYGRYSNAEFDRLMREGARTLDLQERAAILRRAEQIILDEQPLIPLWNGVSLDLVRTYVNGWVDNVQDIHRSRYISIDESARQRQPTLSGGGAHSGPLARLPVERCTG